jgi:hypothetical protein
MDDQVCPVSVWFGLFSTGRLGFHLPDSQMGWLARPNRLLSKFRTPGSCRSHSRPAPLPCALLAPSPPYAAAAQACALLFLSLSEPPCWFFPSSLWAAAGSPPPAAPTAGSPPPTLAVRTTGWPRSTNDCPLLQCSTTNRPSRRPNRD